MAAFFLCNMETFILPLLSGCVIVCFCYLAVRVQKTAQKCSAALFLAQLTFGNHTKQFWLICECIQYQVHLFLSILLCAL